MATVGTIDLSAYLKDFNLEVSHNLQPFQIQMIEAVQQLKEGFRVYSLRIDGVRSQFKAFAQVIRWTYYWKDQHARFQTYGLVRPNGKPRRSGRRHKGMPAWRGHY